MIGPFAAKPGQESNQRNIIPCLVAQAVCALVPSAAKGSKARLLSHIKALPQKVFDVELAWVEEDPRVPVHVRQVDHNAVPPANVQRKSGSGHGSGKVRRGSPDDHGIDRLVPHALLQGGVQPG
jgi:hypothetical protein